MMFAELLMKLMHEDWPKKLAKTNRLIEQSNNSAIKRLTKPFKKVECIVGHTLIIGVLHFCQLGLVLLNDNED